MVVVIDFGSQTAHLIERRLKSLHVETAFLTPDNALPFLKSHTVSGIVFSGGPASVYAKNSPKIDPEILTLGTPLLAICYGAQLTMQMLGGTVVAGKKEYGPSQLKITDHNTQLTKNLQTESTVWMSHGDEIESLPVGFEIVGETLHAKNAFSINKEKKIVATLFHPEVEHSEIGMQLLENFVSYINAPKKEHKIDLSVLEAKIKQKVGDKIVIGAVSGGVDSTVAAALTARAIGKQFIPFYVDNGLMREGTTEFVQSIF
jgi:GMP synthase (glutamine-hydrolysing)